MTALCPFGINGDEPVIEVLGQLMGIREAVLRGLLSEETARDIYPGDYAFTDDERAWAESQS